MSWIDDFMEATIEAESPRSYFWWAGLSAISAVVANRVYVEKFIYKVYPNLYVLLIGKSGLRKSGPISVVKSLVEKTEVTKVISGRASIQKIVQELGKAWTLESGKVLAESNAFICSSEFSSSLVRDEDSLTILTDLHDSHYHTDGWRNLLKSGEDKLKQPCLTLLGATNQVHFDDVIKDTSIMGGFIARTILVVEDKKSRVNPLLDKPEITFKADKFIPYLKQLSELRGEMALDISAKKMFIDWYRDFAEQEIDDKTGTSERLHDRIMKVAMNLSLADSPDMIIREKHMSTAMTACIHGVSLANKATMGSGLNELAGKINILLTRLLGSPEYEMDRKTLLSREWGNFDSIDLDRMVETLNQGGLLTVENRGPKVFYKLTAATIEFYVKDKKKD